MDHEADDDLSDCGDDWQASGRNAYTLFGIPLIASANSPAQMTLVDLRDSVRRQREFDIDASDQARVQLDDAPDNPTIAATVLETAFVKNLGFVRACAGCVFAGANRRGQLYDGDLLRCGETPAPRDPGLTRSTPGNDGILPAQLDMIDANPDMQAGERERPSLRRPVWPPRLASSGATNT